MSEQNIIVDGINNIINKRLEAVFKDLCKTHDNLDYQTLVKQYCKTTTKKKYKKNVVDKCLLCMAKKADGLQCTRRRKVKDINGNIITPPIEYCGKHIKSIKYGRIDDDEKFKDTSRYIKTVRENIDGEYYLVDEKDRVYSYNKEHPLLLGKKVNNKLILLTDLIKMHNNSRDNNVQLKINISKVEAI
tara:strand:- start:42 stop:605 length:564 start_codon:yes stop_codon:yes gene_type:complete